MMEAGWRRPAPAGARPGVHGGLDGALRPGDRRSKEVRRVEHAGARQSLTRSKEEVGRQLITSGAERL